MAALRDYLERGRPARSQRQARASRRRARCSSARADASVHQRRAAPAEGWSARAGTAGGLLAARPAPQLRHPPARRRRRPAQHPGDARARERLHHPDLHSGRVRQAEERLRAQPPSGLNRWDRRPRSAASRGKEPWRPTSNRSSCANCGGATRSTATKRPRAARVAYSPLVKYVAGRTAAGLPPHVEEADLSPTASVGLISAIERFDLSREIKFETYAIMRIKGAIIDELRSLDWVPRSVRARAREVERANAKLEHNLHRRPPTRRSPRSWGSPSTNSTIRCSRSRTPRSWPWTSCGACRTPAATRSR